MRTVTPETPAIDLLAALALRHSGDVFVPECKDGPTQTRAHVRLDAWVLAKTWSPITSIGYEIKVSRGDWRRDQKIHQYMPLCHLLYVVCPKGIVPVDELPAGVGLMEPVGTTGRLQVKHKAARREIVLPSELMVYVLMCRAKITREQGHPDDRHWRTKQLTDWVKEKEDRRALSYAVSEKIYNKFDMQERRIREMEDKLRRVEHVEARIREMGFDPNERACEWKADERLRALSATISPYLLSELQRCSESLLRTRTDLSRLKGQAEGSLDGSGAADAVATPVE